MKKINKIFIVLFLLMGLSSIINQSLRIYSYYRQNTNLLAMNLVQTDYLFTLPQIDYIGACHSEDMIISVGIYLTDYIEEDILGRFYGVNVVIAVTSDDLKIVAHEVSHLIDYVVKQKNIRDVETRAYLQGYFTDCVYTKVKNATI